MDDFGHDAALLNQLAPAVASATWLSALDATGGLQGLVTSPDEALLEHLPERSVRSLRAALRLQGRLQESRPTRPRLHTPQAIAEYLQPHFLGLQYERFVVLSLNSRNRLLRFDVAGEGSSDQCHVDPRRVFRGAIACEASAIILAHNHPSGETEPSAQDLALTRQLREAARQLCIRLLDHLIMGEGVRYTSLLARGLLSGG